MPRKLLRPLVWALFSHLAVLAPHAAAQSTAVDPQKVMRVPPEKGEDGRVDGSSATVETANEPSKGKPKKGGARSGREKADSAQSTVRTADSTKKVPPKKDSHAADRAEPVSTTTATGGREKARSRPATPPVVQAKEPSTAKQKPAVVRVAPETTARVRVPQGRPSERPR